ncbi:MAG: pyridoxal-phosphate dependent enzyme [Terriglobales bacterium]|jgi:cysteine synthase
MTPAASGSAPSQSPSQAEAASGPKGEALLARIGNTPLLSLDAVTRDLPNVELLGKAEWCNPGGSVKDRAAASIVAEARRTSKLAPGKILPDSTSGNTGIAYAMLGAALGFPVTLCVPENVSPERKRILQADGANIIYTDPAEGSPRIKFTTESRRHRGNLFLISSVPRCLRGEMVLQADF